MYSTFPAEHIMSLLFGYVVLLDQTCTADDVLGGVILHHVAVFGSTAGFRLLHYCFRVRSILSAFSRRASVGSLGFCTNKMEAALPRVSQFTYMTTLSLVETASAFADGTIAQGGLHKPVMRVRGSRQRMHLSGVAPTLCVPVWPPSSADAEPKPFC